MYTFVIGPLVWISFIVFIAGTGFQIWRYYRLTHSVRQSSVRPVPDRRPQSSQLSFLHRPGSMLQWLKFTVFTVHPVTITVSTIFHLCLLIVPFFVLGHNMLMHRALGTALPSMPDAFSDGLTITVLLCCGFFLLRRLLLARVRRISSVYDFIVLALAAAPFLTGFLAYHQILGLDYRTLMMVHMISGELMIMAIPFTKLTHMIFFFMNRFLTVNEHTFGRGRRVW